MTFFLDYYITIVISMSFLLYNINLDDRLQDFNSY